MFLHRPVSFNSKAVPKKVVKCSVNIEKKLYALNGCRKINLFFEFLINFFKDFSFKNCGRGQSDRNVLNVQTFFRRNVLFAALTSFR